jgi:hypothetical protein
MLVTHFAHRAGQMTYRKIAEALGMNHYSAVASSIRHLEKLCEKNKHIRRMEKRIRQEITLNQTPALRGGHRQALHRPHSKGEGSRVTIAACLLVASRGTRCPLSSASAVTTMCFGVSGELSWHDGRDTASDRRGLHAQCGHCQRRRVLDPDPRRPCRLPGGAVY